MIKKTQAEFERRTKIKEEKAAKEAEEYRKKDHRGNALYTLLCGVNYYDKTK